MDVFTNTNKFKKIVIVLVFLILFNFCYPKILRAGDGGDFDERILIVVEELFFGLFNGIHEVLELIFLNDKSTETLSVESVIMGKLLITNPNIFADASKRASEYWDYNKVGDGRTSLRNIFSGWYYALRNLAIVALLSILVYVAIRMILSTVSQDKAKYKVMFKDWLVALCLLFIMHYIMVGILNLSDTITKSIGSSGAMTSEYALKKSIQDRIDACNYAVYETTAESITDDSGKTITVKEGIKKAMAETVIYAANVIMLILFLCKYMIRAITIIFLALLAPITCITYPIDKISDGKAQAYNMWFQEFLYNAIIQPFHLLIYIVLIGGATELAKENLIYAMICFGVMIPAEKFIKQMFGFKDKLGSPLGAFASGAVANQMMNSLRSLGKGGSGGGSGKDSDSGKGDDLPPTTKDVDLPNATKSEGFQTEENLRKSEESHNKQLGDEENSENETKNNGIEVTNGNVTDGSEYDNKEEEKAENQAVIDEQQAGENEAVKDEQQTGGNEAVIDEQQAAENQSVIDGQPGSETLAGVNEEVKDGQGDKGKDGFWAKGANAAKARFSRNLMKKYGTNKFGIKDAKKKWKEGDKKGALSSVGKGVLGRAAVRGFNKAYKGAKNTGRKVIKGTIKGATTLVGAAALGAFGAMFGKGAEGMALGAGLGGSLGNKVGNTITKGTDKITEKTEEYAGEIYNAYGNHAEEKKKREFKENENNIKLARQNYRDRYGKEPIGAALDGELEKMFTMNSHGIEKGQFNDVLGQAKEYMDDGMSEKDAMNTAMTSALYAQSYSRKDFADEKTMGSVYAKLYERYEDDIKHGKISKEQADKNIKNILNGGAKMKGEKSAALPKPKDNTATVDIPINREIPDLATNLGIGESSLTDERVKRLTKLRAKLIDKGYTPEQIEKLAQLSKDSAGDEDGVIGQFEDRVELAIEYIGNDSARQQAEQIVSGANGNAASTEQVDSEMRDRFILKSTFNVEEESKVTDIRKEEEKRTPEKTQQQAAREFARANIGDLKSNGKVSEGAREDLIKRLSGGDKTLSSDKIKKDADNIISLAEIYTAADKI